MRRSGTAWPWMLLLFGSACGDRVIVARGASLVSAAQTIDGGVGDARADRASHAGTTDGGPSDHHRSTSDSHDKNDKDDDDKDDKDDKDSNSSTNDSKRH